MRAVRVVVVDKVTAAPPEAADATITKLEQAVVQMARENRSLEKRLNAPDCRAAVRAALLEVRVSVTRRLCATASTRVAAAYACVRDDIDAKLAELERQPTREGPC